MRTHYQAPFPQRYPMGTLQAVHDFYNLQDTSGTKNFLPLGRKRELTIAVLGGRWQFRGWQPLELVTNGNSRIHFMEVLT